MANHILVYNLDGKIFRSTLNSENGEVGPETRFYYHQRNKVISAEYSGGDIASGHLLGLMKENGQLDFQYHHLKKDGQLMAGACRSTPYIFPDGRLKFTEEWRWYTGDGSSGISEIEEIKNE